MPFWLWGFSFFVFGSVFAGSCSPPPPFPWSSGLVVLWTESCKRSMLHQQGLLAKAHHVLANNQTWMMGPHILVQACECFACLPRASKLALWICNDTHTHTRQTSNYFLVSGGLRRSHEGVVQLQSCQTQSKSATRLCDFVTC